MAMRTRLEPADIVVPASVANLGPGLDTLAVALQLYLHVRAQSMPGQGKNELRFDFVGFELDGENFIERAFRLHGSTGRRGVSLAQRGSTQRDPQPLGVGQQRGSHSGGIALVRCLVRPLSHAETAECGLRVGRPSRQRRGGAARRPDHELRIGRQLGDRALHALARGHSLRCTDSQTSGWTRQLHVGRCRSSSGAKTRSSTCNGWRCCCRRCKATSIRCCARLCATAAISPFA